jgi:putative FmdB family regulatory protein
MPIFEYKCRECGAMQEALVLGGDEEPACCGRCGADSIERVLSTPSAMTAFNRPKGQTCCGREERCDTPPCFSGSACAR